MATKQIVDLIGMLEKTLCDPRLDPSAAPAVAAELEKYRAYTCPVCGNDCSGECETNNWDRGAY